MFRHRLCSRQDRTVIDTPLEPRALQSLLDRAAEEVETGALPSCQLAIARDGELVHVATFGAATDASRYTVFSVTKALIGAAVWVMLGEELLTAQTRIADVIPEFASNGKQDVTVAQVMSHTGGFPRAPIRTEDGATTEGRLRRFASWRLDWAPGTQMEYHAVSAHWVLAQLIENLTGRDYRTYTRSRILDPLGLRRLRLGVPLAEQGDILDVVLTGEAPAEAPPVPVVAVDEMALGFNQASAREVGVPGAGGVSDAADIAMLYQAMLHNPGGLWDPDVLVAGTSTVINRHLDPFTGVPANRTLGLVVAGDDGNGVVREFGKATGPRAFGASGLGGQVAWADPDSGLSFCYLTNGLEINVITSFLRSSRLSTLAARTAP
jgi:CubicO group peptidase (beta-lactamase class C family)